ncbi:TPA: MBL fold metallo-hydrolase [bacterium]|jgi:glyoxylase-like metal-dependent hydrolase (beta-lactamase superfamily II)|nr:MBL fold metallo-hydrolase [bacterium]
MIFRQVFAGGDRNFGYLIGDEKSRDSAVIDPASSPKEFIKLANELNLKIVYIINTHSHGDHTGGNSELKNLTKAKVVMHKSSPISTDIKVSDGDILKLGHLELMIIHTPGHTSDSICILVENKLMTGDTLFVGKIGGTHTDQDAKTEFDSLFNKLMKLDKSIEVYPGHDYGIAPTSTIENELETNPFIIRSNFDDFKWLKDNWASYKLEHGIK